MTFRAEFDAEVWRWNGEAAWYFVSLPHDLADEIDERFGGSAAGFGSIPVHVTVGSSTWSTSLFPSKQEATYLLPVKKPVRRAEGLDEGAVARIELDVDLDRL